MQCVSRLGCRLAVLGRIAVMVAVIGAFIGADLMTGTRSASAQTATTTSTLNLRAQARTTAPVKLVMPAGATVEVIRRLSNGFYRIVY